MPPGGGDRGCPQRKVRRRQAFRAGGKGSGRSARKIARLLQSVARDPGGDLMASPERQIIRPYGDRRDDGVVQLSFTFPVPLTEKAKEAAAQFVRKLGFSDVKVAAAEPAAANYTFFVVYARSPAQMHFSEIH